MQLTDICLSVVFLLLLVLVLFFLSSLHKMRNFLVSLKNLKW